VPLSAGRLAPAWQIWFGRHILYFKRVASCSAQHTAERLFAFPAPSCTSNTLGNTVRRRCTANEAAGCDAHTFVRTLRHPQASPLHLPAWPPLLRRRRH